MVKRFTAKDMVIPAPAELDLGTLADLALDTVVWAKTEGVATDDITVAAVGDEPAAATAFLDLGALAGGDLDTVVEAAAGDGYAGNDLTVAAVGDSGLGAGVTIDESTDNIVIHYESGVSTVAHVETAIGLSAKLAVKTGGTGGTTLTAPGDNFTATALAGGADGTVVITEVGDAVEIHYVDGVSTVGDVETAIGSGSTLIAVKTAGTGATTLVAADDDFAATNLAGGVDAEAVDISGAEVGSVKVHALTAALTGTYVLELSPDGTNNWNTAGQDITAKSIKAIAQSAARIRLNRGVVTAGALDKVTVCFQRRIG